MTNHFPINGKSFTYSFVFPHSQTEVKMEDMILPPGSVCSTDETLESGHWAPPLQNRRVSMTFFYDVAWKYQIMMSLGSDHLGKCPNLPLSSWAKVIRRRPPSDTPFSCAQAPSWFKVGVGFNVSLWLRCEEWPRCGRIIKPDSSFQLFLQCWLSNTYAHSSEPVHAAQPRSEMWKLCFS